MDMSSNKKHCHHNADVNIKIVKLNSTNLVANKSDNF